MTAGRTTRPLNLREVVASWDEIKLHASMKFGCELETNVGWEGRTVQPAGLQARGRLSAAHVFAQKKKL